MTEGAGVARGWKPAWLLTRDRGRRERFGVSSGFVPV